MTQKEIQNGWTNFIDEYTHTILPIYENHEQTFDFVGLHGRRHLTRSLIFAEILGRFYFLMGEKSIDFDGIRIAVSYHDSGREGNGTDYWESESSENCRNYLIDNGKTKAYANKISSMILQKKGDIKIREEQIVYDVDVIEIIRVFSSRENFRKKELFFLGENNLHNNFSSVLKKMQAKFLNEFWNYLENTEKKILAPSNDRFVEEYIAFFQKEKEKYELMNLVYDFKWSE